MAYQKLTPIIATGTTEPRYIGDRFADIINVKDFGAKGDGVTDDTSAIQDAFDYASLHGISVIFPSGVYSCSPISVAAGFIMFEGAILKYNGDGTDDEFISITSNNLNFGDVYIDCNEKEVRRGLLIGTNGNHFRSVHVSHMTSSTRLTVGILITGSNNSIDNIEFIDLVNTGWWNDSSPQGLTLSDPENGICTENVFCDVKSINARSTIVNNSTGLNDFGNVYSHQCKDNGFYAVAAGVSNIGTIFYDGDDNGLGIRHGASVNCNSIILERTGSAGVFFGNGKEANIGTILVKDVNGCILGLNSTMDENASGFEKIKIGSILGSVKDTYAVFLPSSRGTVQEKILWLSIGSVNLTASYSSSQLADNIRASFFRLDACDYITIGDINIDIRVPEGTDDLTFYIKAKTSALANYECFGNVVSRYIVNNVVSDFSALKIQDYALGNFAYVNNIKTFFSDLTLGNGAISLSNGLQVCWGGVQATNGAGSVTFPKEFSNNPNVIATVGGGVGVYATLGEISTSGCTLYTFAGTSRYQESRNVNYIAIGRG